MSRLPTSAEIRRIGGTDGFELFIDGIQFPWHIERQAVEVVNLTPDNPEPWFALRLGLIIGGPVTGADEFNAYLEDESGTR